LDCVGAHPVGGCDPEDREEQEDFVQAVQFPEGTLDWERLARTALKGIVEVGAHRDVVYVLSCSGPEVLAQVPIRSDVASRIRERISNFP
jgi:hypothetical protein